MEAVFAHPRDYNPKADARVVIIDRFRPAALPDADTIWIEPPAGASPFSVSATLKGARLERWHGENVLGAGLHTRDLRLDTAQVFSAAPGDLAVADCAGGPVILARPGKHKAVALGFHPGRAATRFELATPLLFANLLGWMAPEVFRQWELNSASVGTVTAALDPGVDPADGPCGGRGRALAAVYHREQLPALLHRHPGHRADIRRESGDGLLADPARCRGCPLGATQGNAARASCPRRVGILLTRPLADAGAGGRAGLVRSSGCGSARGGRPGMSFGRAWVLLFAILPAAWAAWEWRRTARKAALVLKLSAFLCVLLALSEPGLRVAGTRMAVAILVDTSSSVSEQDLKHASQLVSAMEKARGRHWVRVVPFARSARQVDSGERAPSGKLHYTAGEAGEATDLEAALREALATLPAGLVPRVALISDGKENRGSIARGATLLQQLGVPVDTFTLAGRPKPGFVIER